MKAIKCGTFIGQLRRAKNWAQADLAKRVGVTDKAVSRWETGKGYPDVTILPQLAALFDVSISELISGQKLSQQNQQAQAEKLLLSSMRIHLDKMMTAATILLLSSFVMIILGFKMWYSFGWASDTFIGFHKVMENGGFGSLPQILCIILPLIMLGLSGYILTAGSRKEISEENLNEIKPRFDKTDCEDSDFK